MMSHSCFPNAIGKYDGSGNNVCRSRRDIKAGEEVSLSYVAEEDLVKPIPYRRWDLWKNKHFWCDCERCSGARDFCRGFKCNNCDSGTIYALPPKPGPAASPELLASELVGASCDCCGHA